MSDDNTQAKQNGGKPNTWNTVPSFEVEFGDQHCRNHSINTFKVKVRGAWSIATLAGRPEGARDIGSAMASVPATPGQRLAVLPQKKMAILHDPLEKDETLLKRLNAALRRGNRVGGDIAPVPKSEFKLTDDLLQTLTRELIRKVENGDATVTAGELPTLKELERLPGHELYDPWNSNARKPKYKRDVDEYERELERQS